MGEKSHFDLRVFASRIFAFEDSIKFLLRLDVMRLKIIAIASAKRLSHKEPLLSGEFFWPSRVLLTA